MTFTENETITLRHLGILGVDVQGVVVEHCQYVEYREVTTDMACLA
jgi:hypothetical protein